MTRARSIFAVVGASLAWAAVTACNQTTIPTKLRSFDRPSDVALTCVQYFPNVRTDEHPHGVYNVRPLADCEPVRAITLANVADYAPDPNFTPTLGPGNYTPFLVALVPQSARGELALVDTAQSRLIDLDPYTPDYGFVPVGKLPEHVRASKDGCVALTSNTDSCDLSRVDVSTVLHSSLLSFFPEEVDMGTHSAIVRGVKQMPLSVPSASGGDPKILYARPSWVEMAPENDGGDKPSKHGYDDDNANPGMCSGGSHHAWVALPGCQLVVKVHLEAVDTPPGAPTKPTIDRALHVDASGVTEVTDLSTIECPVECAGGHGDVAIPDAGVTPPPSDMGAGNPLSTQSWPSALAIDAEADVSGTALAGRLVIADGHGERIHILPFDIVKATFGPTQTVTLDPGDNGLLLPGVNVVRVGPRSEAGKFLYAVARDGSVRVIDLDRGVECETNPDPRWQTPAINLQETPTRPTVNDPWTFPVPPPRSLGCFPLGDPSTPPRSLFATSPGISLAPGQIPADVAFVHVDTPPGDPINNAVAPVPASPGVLVGDFAWIVSSDGKGTIVNIYDACPQPNQQLSTATPGNYTKACDPVNVQHSLSDTVAQFGHPQPLLLERLSHQIRMGTPRFFLPQTQSDSTGQPRVPDPTNPCAVSVPATSPGSPDGGVPDAGACGSNAGNLPSLYAEPVPAPLAPTSGETRVVYFVDPKHVRNETWVLSWEGVLAGSDRTVGAPLVVPGSPPSGPQDRAYLSDSGGAWCGRGVLAGDKVIFGGCTVDAQCDQAAGYLCVRDPGAFPDVSQGMCLHVGPRSDGAPDDTVDTWSTKCGDLLRSQRKFRILSAKQGTTVPQYPTTPPAPGMPGTPPTSPPAGSKTDLLELGEIYEPEFAEETRICTSNADCDGTAMGKPAITVLVQPDNVARGTLCLPDADGQKRCIRACDPTVMKDAPDQTPKECGFDFQCLQSAFGDNRCMRAPIGGATHWQLCMPELQEYEIHVGDAFTVSGTTSGYLSNERARADGECEIPPQTLARARLTQWRVPLTAPACPANVDAKPLSESIDPTMLARNVCSVQTVPNGVERIHFENPIFNVAVQVPLSPQGQPLVPPDGTSVTMTVTGGGANLTALLGVDVQAQQPRYVAVAPDGQTVYIVDEGKSPASTGLRGQLLRLFSPSQSIDTTFVVR